MVRITKPHTKVGEMSLHYYVEGENLVPSPIHDCLLFQSDHDNYLTYL